jgi:segregation and condensation protein B
MMRVIWQDGTSTTVNEEQDTTPKPAAGRRRRKERPISELETPPLTLSISEDENAATPMAPEAGEGIDADGPVIAEEAAREAAESEAAAIEAVEPEAAVDLGVLEALLFGTHHPLTSDRIKELMSLKTSKHVRRSVQSLNAQYEQSGRTFRVEQVAGGYQLLSLPEYGDYLKKLHQKEIDTKLTKAALETLAIIAYKQPILRAEVESIRGVACGETIRSLMEKHLVRIAGRAEEPGRPILYGTTKRFLELFGLNSLKDLPQAGATGAAQQ